MPSRPGPTARRRGRRRRPLRSLTNREIAARLREAADLLRDQEVNPYRVEAYEQAARTVHGLGEPIAELRSRGGVQALVALPGIGSGIAAAIEEMLRSGHWSLLERLHGRHDPEELLCRVRGIGEALAERIHDELEIDSLEALEMAAHDGRLEEVQGVGSKTVVAVREAIAEMLGRGAGRDPEGAPDEQGDDRPPVRTLLDVDRFYERDVIAKRLQRIAPRRFNDSGHRWLPVGHYRLEGWDFTALFSNSRRAHQLHRTRDWVVLWFYDRHHRESHATVYTATTGQLFGQRVVRGRELECGDFYENNSTESD